MTPIDHLRAADPAADLRFDERAERDLATLLTTPRTASAPRSAPPRARSPLLVTAVVAVLLIAVTAAVLAVVRPRTDVAAPTATATLHDVVEPPYRTTGCDPKLAVPFECGTYRSVGGGAAAGSGPRTEPLSISFVPQNGVLVMTAWWGTCTAASVPLRYEAGRLEHVGEVLVGSVGRASCTGTGPDDGSWADAFIRGPLTVRVGDGLVFGSGASAVDFEYQGAGEFGDPQIPRDDATCVAAHVKPFGCTPWRATAGTGTLAFLRSEGYRLTFLHTDARLTARFTGRCDTLTVALLVVDGGATLVGSRPVGTVAACAASPAHDEAMTDFFTAAGLSYERYGSELTFTSEDGANSATFRLG